MPDPQDTTDSWHVRQLDGPMLVGEASRLRGEQRIKAGEWTPGTRVPHQATLAAEFGASHKTVARAVYVLALKGMVRRAGNSYYAAQAFTD